MLHPETVSLATVSLETVSLRLAVPAEELADWIARGWVQPQGQAGDWLFAEIDVARTQLVRDLRLDAGIETESLAMVLSLLDQVHAMRRALRTVLDGLAAQPDPVRRAVLARLDPPAGT